MVVQNQNDGKTYEIRFDPARGSLGDLNVGSDVNVTAEFDGKDYSARMLTVLPAKTNR
jgi:hypothetical protein